jgi:hypothetical protein
VALYEHQAFQKRQMTLGLLLLGDGRVEMWRGGGRLGISVSAPFVWQCLTGEAIAPFPHPAHRPDMQISCIGVLGQDVKPSPTARCTAVSLPP